MKPFALLLVLICSSFEAYSKVPSKTFDAEILGITCSRGMIQSSGEVFIRNIAVSNDWEKEFEKVGNRELRLEIEQDACLKLMPKIGNCTKQIVTLITDDDSQVVEFSSYRIKKGMRICQ